MAKARATPIVLLETEGNAKGDLFNRIVSDLFHSLGYDPVRVNVHKTGREIDVLGQHRLEPRRYVRAECKATAEAIGGDEINKFVGALDAERHQIAQTAGPAAVVTGYFVSLSGFTQAALVQEEDLGNQRLTLLTEQRVVDELIRGRISVTREQVIDRAGRVVPRDSRLELDSLELLAHTVGLVWAVYYKRDGRRSHFCLVHADGGPLSGQIAEQVIASASSHASPLKDLDYLQNPLLGPSEETLSEAKRAYFKYLEAACGEIQLDGLPPDEQAGSKRLRIESLFVPAHVIEAKQSIAAEMSGTLLGRASASRRRRGRRLLRTQHHGEQLSEPSQVDEARRPVGEVLAHTTRLALLAAPGGGKSTLLKRLAVAYAFPERRVASRDALPEREWLPFFLRCRDLGGAVRDPILKALSVAAERAEIGPDLLESFSVLLRRALVNGNALLLVDGLDEIPDDGDRVAFVSALRTFLGTYSTVSLVVTSREAGFRVVAGALGAECQRYRIADFDSEDIQLLVGSWHREVYGPSAKGEGDARALGEAIIGNDRIRRLAGNPMLLTTLLLVKRWVGQLPTKRTVLYDKAIEVLLMTWNVQAHAPIPLDEAMPRLEFIAFTMMKRGMQSISRPRLLSVLHEAHQELPEVLGYSQFSDTEFIDRVELRSSLLIQGGHSVERGRLVPLYEFRHLTFQEYLVARAIVDGYYPGRTTASKPIQVLSEYIDREEWQEVVPLTAVLAGRDAGEIVSELVKRCKKSKFPREALLLAHCLLDEVQVTPALVDEALRATIRIGGGLTQNTSIAVRALARGKFGAALRKIVIESYRESADGAVRYGSALANVTTTRLGWSEEDIAKGSVDVAEIRSLLSSSEELDKASGALVLMLLAFTHGQQVLGVLEVADEVAPLLGSAHPHVQHAACWALAWLGDRCGWSLRRRPEALPALLKLWNLSGERAVERQAAWAMCAMPPVSRDDVSVGVLTRGETSRIKSSEKDPVVEEWPFRSVQAALTCAYYFRKPWSDAELIERIAREMPKRASFRSQNDKEWGKRLLAQLGDAGLAKITELRLDLDEEEQRPSSS